MTQLYVVTCLSILMFFILQHTTLSLDYYYETCKPRLCGGLSITYPFYVQGLQDSICGYPGYEITCNSLNDIVIKLSGDDYVIRNISYDNRLVNVVNNAFIDGAFDCSPSIHNLSLHSNIFKFIGDHNEILWLQNCTEEAMQGITKYQELSCVNNNSESSNMLLVAYARDMVGLEKVVGKCERVTLVPYQGSDKGAITDALARGMVLQWSAGGCADCVHSGGRCGFIRTSSSVVCFCPDGPTSRRCTS